MKKIKQSISDDLTGFIFWLIFLIIVLLEVYNIKFVFNSIAETLIHGIGIDFILIILVSLGIPSGFIVLTYYIWFKK